MAIVSRCGPNWVQTSGVSKHWSGAPCGQSHCTSLRKLSWHDGDDNARFKPGSWWWLEGLIHKFWKEKRSIVRRYQAYMVLEDSISTLSERFAQPRHSTCRRIPQPIRVKVVSVSRPWCTTNSYTNIHVIHSLPRTKLQVGSRWGETWQDDTRKTKARIRRTTDGLNLFQKTQGLRQFVRRMTTQHRYFRQCAKANVYFDNVAGCLAKQAHFQIFEASRSVKAEEGCGNNNKRSHVTITPARRKLQATISY